MSILGFDASLASMNTWLHKQRPEVLKKIREHVAGSDSYGHIREYVGCANGERLAVEDVPDFAVWMALVSFQMRKRFGVALTDISDQPWRDWFEDDLKPSQAIAQAMEQDALLSLMISEGGMG